MNSSSNLATQPTSVFVSDIRTALEAIRRLEKAPGLNASELMKLAELRVELQQIARRLNWR